MLLSKTMAWLVWVVGYSQARHEAGLLIAQDAEAILGISGGDESIRADLLNKTGVVHFEIGEYEKALENFRNSFVILEKRLGPEHPSVATPLSNMGSVFNNTGEYDDALKYLCKALAVREKALGLEHPAVAQSLNNIGEVFRSLGEYDKASEYHHKALAVVKSTLGPDHPEVAWTLSSLGTVFLIQGIHEKALNKFRRALSVFEKALGSKHPAVAGVLASLGVVFVEQGKQDDALEAFERALSLSEKGGSCCSLHHGLGLFGLAQSLVSTGGDKERAIKLANRAREIYGKTPKRFKKELEEVNAWLKKHDHDRTKSISTAKREP